MYACVYSLVYLEVLSIWKVGCFTLTSLGCVMPWLGSLCYFTLDLTKPFYESSNAER